MTAKDAKGMAGIKSRTTKGPLRELRNDILVKTLEEKYDVDFEVRGDMKLRTLEKRLGAYNVKDLLKKAN